MIDSIAPTTLIQDRYYVLRVLRPLEFGWLYSVVDRRMTHKRSSQLPVCLLEEVRIPDSLRPYLNRLAEQLRLEIQQIKEAKARSGKVSTDIPDYDEVIVADDRLFLKQYYVNHFSYGQVLEDRTLTGEGDAILSESEAWELLDAIEPILKALHRQGLSHDNLSPETIIWQVAAQQPGLMHFGGMRSVIQPMSAPLHTLDFEPTVLNCPMQTDWVNLAETTLVLLGDPDWNTLSLQLAQRLRKLLEASPQSRLPSFKNNLTTNLFTDFRHANPAAIDSPEQTSFQPVLRQNIGRSRTPKRSGLMQNIGKSIGAYFRSLPSLSQDPLLWGMALLIFGLSGILGYRVLMTQARKPDLPESNAAFVLPTADPNAPDSNISTPDPSMPPLSDELKQQLRSLQVSDSWFGATVAEMSGESNIAPGDDRWNANSKTLIQALEKLTPETRQNIGSYRRADFDQWLSQSTTKPGSTKPTSSKQIEDQTDAQFFTLLPDRKGKAQNPRQLGQIWYAIARQILKPTN